MKTAIKKLLVDKKARNSKKVNNIILASANEGFLQWALV